MKAGEAISLAMLAFTLSGCSEVSLTKPDLELASNAQRLDSPLELQIVDDQANDRGGGYASHLAGEIRSAFPHAIELAQAPVEGRANLTLHIHFLGAHFNRSKNALLPNQSILTAARGTIDGWQPVVAAAAGQGAVSSGTVFVNLPGNWSGVAYFDAEIRDLRPGHNATLVIPIASEHSAPNKLGALQAEIQADSAWEAVAPRLTALLDATIAKLAAEQN